MLLAIIRGAISCAETISLWISCVLLWISQNLGRWHALGAIVIDPMGNADIETLPS